MFFDNLFNSPALIQNLHEDGLYGLGTAQCDRKDMSEMKEGKEMSRGDFQCKYGNGMANDIQMV